jgi:hypothetical protein
MKSQLGWLAYPRTAAVDGGRRLSAAISGYSRLSAAVVRRWAFVAGLLWESPVQGQSVRGLVNLWAFGAVMLFLGCWDLCCSLQVLLLDRSPLEPVAVLICCRLQFKGVSICKPLEFSVERSCGGIANTRISTDSAQKSPRSLLRSLLLNCCLAREWPSWSNRLYDLAEQCS